MEIIKKEEFDKSLFEILDYIAKDSLSRALNFQDELEKKINALVNFPHKFRQSIYFNDGNIRVWGVITPSPSLFSKKRYTK